MENKPFDDEMASFGFLFSLNNLLHSFWTIPYVVSMTVGGLLVFVNNFFNPLTFPP